MAALAIAAVATAEKARSREHLPRKCKLQQQHPSDTAKQGALLASAKFVASANWVHHTAATTRSAENIGAVVCPRPGISRDYIHTQKKLGTLVDLTKFVCGGQPLAASDLCTLFQDEKGSVAAVESFASQLHGGNRCGRNGSHNTAASASRPMDPSDWPMAMLLGDVIVCESNEDERVASDTTKQPLRWVTRPACCGGLRGMRTLKTGQAGRRSCITRSFRHKPTASMFRPRRDLGKKWNYDARALK